MRECGNAGMRQEKPEKKKKWKKINSPQDLAMVMRELYVHDINFPI